MFSCNPDGFGSIAGHLFQVNPMQISVAEAKSRFAEMVRRAEAGEAIELTRYGRPVARIVSVEHRRTRALIGAMHGMFTVPDDILEGDAETEEMFRTREQRIG